MAHDQTSRQPGIAATLRHRAEARALRRSLRHLDDRLLGDIGQLPHHPGLGRLFAGYGHRSI